MKEEVVERSNLIHILRRSKVAVNNKDVFVLKNLSNSTIHSAAIHQDTDSISVAVLIYSLSKIVGRMKYSAYKDWPAFIKAVNSGLDEASHALEQNDIESFRNALTKLRKTMAKPSGNLKSHIENVFKRAKINKASRLYEHGISLGQTASILGISLFELSEYAGRTGIPDVQLSVTMPLKERFKMAWEFMR